MTHESEVQQLIQIEARKYNCILMRNNSGCLLDADGRAVRFGLGNISKLHNDQIKSSDLIGFTKILITPDMVGKTVAIFTAIEVKESNWKPDKKLDKHETAQNNFLKWIKNNGGIAAFCNCYDQLREIFKK